MILEGVKCDKSEKPNDTGCVVEKQESNKVKAWVSEALKKQNFEVEEMKNENSEFGTAV